MASKLYADAPCRARRDARTSLSPDAPAPTAVTGPGPKAPEDAMTRRRPDPRRAAAAGAALAATLVLGTGTALAQDDAGAGAAAAAATVDGRAIPAMAVDNVARQLEADGRAADRATILDELVDMEVLAQAAERAGLDAEPAIATALALQRMQTLANAWLADASDRIEITDEELREEYARQRSALVEREFRASHVLLPTEAEAREALAALDAGTAFETLVVERSLDPAGGGDLGWVARGGIDDALVEALEGLAPGRVAPEPVATDFGFHVLRLDEARAASPPDFTAVRDGLRELVLRRRLAERVAAMREAADVTLP